MNFLKKLLQAVSGKKYRKNPSGSLTAQAELRALGAGMINSEQIMAYCDSYTTGLERAGLIQALEDSWDVSTPQGAVETLKELSDYGRRYFYDIIFRVYMKEPAADTRTEILEALIHSGRYGEPEKLRELISAPQACEEKYLIFAALEKAEGMLDNFKAVFRTLNDDVNGAYTPQDYSAGIMAWDLGRLVTLARMSFDCDYIDQFSLAQILAHVDSELRANFSSWPQFAKSYVIGRASSFGPGVMHAGIVDIAQDLMTDENSPWLLSPL